MLINVFDKLLQNNFKSIKLLLIGNKKSFDNYLKNLDQDTRKNIITIGPVDHFKIPFYLNLADILILPTLNNIHGMYYTSPLKLFEYLATKKTLICSDNPAIKEIVDENIVYFFKSANEDSLYQVLSNLLKTNKKEMKNQIFDLENFSYKIRALKVFNFINDLSNER